MMNKVERPTNGTRVMRISGDEKYRQDINEITSLVHEAYQNGATDEQCSTLTNWLESILPHYLSVKGFNLRLRKNDLKSALRRRITKITSLVLLFVLMASNGCVRSPKQEAVTYKEFILLENVPTFGVMLLKDGSKARLRLQKGSIIYIKKQDLGTETAPEKGGVKSSIGQQAGKGCRNGVCKFKGSLSNVQRLPYATAPRKL